MRGSEVRRIREGLGLTQAKFAKLVGVHPITVSKWENDSFGIRESAARLMKMLANQGPKARKRS